MFSAFWKAVARWWAVNDRLPAEVNLVVPVAHGATKNRLTKGAEAVTKITKGVLRYYHWKPEVIFGAFAGSPQPETEMLEKIKNLSGRYIGPVWSTIEECAGVRALYTHRAPKAIIVVTDQAHSRRAKIVWRTFFPKSSIYIVSIPLERTLDPESPMTIYRGGLFRALIGQAWPTPIFWFWSLFGPSYMLDKARFHQSTKPA